MNVVTLTAQDFASKYHREMRIIDVRSPAEYKSQHVAGAENMPLDKLKTEDFCQSIKNNEVYLICQKGGRATQAAAFLSVHTQAKLFVIDGGTPESIAHGCPGNSTTEAVMSIERQVRVAAGSLVLIGSLLGLMVAPVFMVIPVFVGAGLMFAGLTDSCAMGMVLSKMPWNQ